MWWSEPISWARAGLLAALAAIDYATARWARQSVPVVAEEDARQWIRMLGGLCRITIVDGLLMGLLSLLPRTHSEWGILLSMLGMCVHLLSRLAYNAVFALQVRHYCLLRGSLLREEWRTVIGTVCACTPGMCVGVAIFATVADVSLRFPDANPSVFLGGSWFATVACSATFYAYLAAVTALTQGRLRTHLRKVSTKWQVSAHLDPGIDRKVQRLTAFCRLDWAVQALIAASFASIAAVSIVAERQGARSDTGLVLFGGAMLVTEQAGIAALLVLCWVSVHAHFRQSPQ